MINHPISCNLYKLGVARFIKIEIQIFEKFFKYHSNSLYFSLLSPILLFISIDK